MHIENLTIITLVSRKEVENNLQHTVYCVGLPDWAEIFSRDFK